MRTDQLVRYVLSYHDLHLSYMCATPTSSTIIHTRYTQHYTGETDNTGKSSIDEPEKLRCTTPRQQNKLSRRHHTQPTQTTTHSSGKGKLLAQRELRNQIHVVTQTPSGTTHARIERTPSIQGLNGGTLI